MIPLIVANDFVLSVNIINGVSFREKIAKVQKQKSTFLKSS